MSKTMNMVVGAFPTESAARNVVEDLQKEGFDEHDIHASYEDSARHRGFFQRLFGAKGGRDWGPYSDAIARGECLVAVDTDEEGENRAAKIMNQYGATDIEGQGTNIGTPKESGTTTAPPPARSGEGSGERSIPVIEEEITVGKRAVLRGGVRVFSHVVEEPVEEEIRLREEKARVERRPVNRPATEADADALRDQTIEVTETSEEPVVQKERRVVEEVVIGKDQTERTEKIRDTVRRTDVDIERIPAENYGPEFRKDFDTRYMKSGFPYTDYEPAYEYGYSCAYRPEYRGRTIDQIEPDLKTAYMREYPSGNWAKVKDAVRYGYTLGAKPGRSSTK